MSKVLFMTNIPVPYRVAFFNELGKNTNLTVVYERKSAKTREKEWLQSKNDNFESIFMKGIHVGDDCAFCPEIIKIIKKGCFDFIIVGAYYTPTGMLAIEYMNRHNICYGFSGDGGFIKNDRRLKYLIKKHFQKNGKFYFSPSKNGDDVVKHYGASEDKIYRYPFSSLVEKDILHEPVSQSEKQIIRNQLNIKYDKVVLAVGRLVSFKAWEYLPQMAKILGNDVGIYLIGGKSEGSCYQKLFEEYNAPNFHVIDFKSKEELWKWYKAADVLAFPTRGDVWGLVVNEALACGLPVVTTDMCVSGRELIKNGFNGYMVRVDDLEALSNSVSKIINLNEIKYKEMQNNSLNVIKDYTIEKMADAYLAALNIMS